MKRNRWLCVVLAMVLSFPIQPALAAGNVRSTIITATCRLPVIQVAVPSKGSTYVNPLQIPVRIADEESDEQIISIPACIANLSEVPLQVDVAVTSQIPTNSSLILSSTPTGGVGTDKRAFLYFEIQQTNSEDPNDTVWDSAYDGTKHILLENGVTVTRNAILTLPARTLDGEVAENGYAAFHLTGDAVKNPDTPWNSGVDGVGVNIAFTFTPLFYS